MFLKTGKREMNYIFVSKKKRKGIFLKKVGFLLLAATVNDPVGLFLNVRNLPSSKPREAVAT